MDKMRDMFLVLSERKVLDLSLESTNHVAMNKCTFCKGVASF